MRMSSTESEPTLGQINKGTKGHGSWGSALVAELWSNQMVANTKASSEIIRSKGLESSRSKMEAHIRANGMRMPDTEKVYLPGPMETV